MLPEHMLIKKLGTFLEAAVNSHTSRRLHTSVVRAFEFQDYIMVVTVKLCKCSVHMTGIFLNKNIFGIQFQGFLEKCILYSCLNSQFLIFNWYITCSFNLVLPIFNEAAYLIFKSIFRKTLNLLFDSEIMLESVPGTNQY